MSVRSERTTLSVDYRELIIRKMKEKGADSETGFVNRGTYSFVAKELGIHHSTVKNVWSLYVTSGSLEPRDRPGKPRKLHSTDIDYIKLLKTETPSITHSEIRDKLEEFANISVDASTICRAVKRKLDPGQEWTSKKIIKPAVERFTDRNMAYTQVFIDVLHNINPNRLKFFDESGFQLPGCCNPTYGHSRKGERAVEVHRYQRTPNVTLNLLIGVAGVSYANIIDGASNTDTFLNFFDEALNSTDNNGDLCLSPGDLVIVDNCPTHRFRGERIMALLLGQVGIEYVFTPAYSPTMNPVELCFQHIKCVMRSSELRSIALDNLHYAIMTAVNRVTGSDCEGYFRQVGYLGM